MLVNVNAFTSSPASSRYRLEADGSEAAIHGDLKEMTTWT
jgi:hypothetical protein